MSCVVVPVSGGTLYDGTGNGFFEIDDQVLYWVSGDARWVVDLTREGELRIT